MKTMVCPNNYYKLFDEKMADIWLGKFSKAAQAIADCGGAALATRLQIEQEANALMHLLYWESRITKTHQLKKLRMLEHPRALNKQTTKSL